VLKGLEDVCDEDQTSDEGELQEAMENFAK